MTGEMTRCHGNHCATHERRPTEKKVFAEAGRFADAAENSHVAV